MGLTMPSREKFYGKDEYMGWVPPRRSVVVGNNAISSIKDIKVDRPLSLKEIKMRQIQVIDSKLTKSRSLKTLKITVLLALHCVISLMYIV